MSATTTPKVPSLSLQKATGQGYVRPNGRFVYLGAFNAPETQQRYHRLISEWLASGPLCYSQ